MICTDIIYRAMALKALDQRMAGSSGSSLAANTQPHSPRVPPPAAAARPDSPAMPSSPAVVKERQGSVGEADIGQTAKTKEESR